MKNMVLLSNTSVVKDSSIAPSLFFSHFFIFLFFLSFFWWASLASFFYLGFFGLFYFDNLTWDNVLIMMIITLLFTYNSILQLDV